MIEVQGLTKKYGDLVAVSRLELQGREGPHLGPARTERGRQDDHHAHPDGVPPGHGRHGLGRGFDVFDQPRRSRDLGYLPEVLPLYPDMTVTEYLGFVADLKGVPQAKSRTPSPGPSVAGLEDVKGRLIRNISRGFKQRVGIAQALVHEPKVLILDEPTIGLDPAQIREIRELIRGSGASTRSSCRPTSCPRSPRPATAWSSSTRAGSWPRARWPTWPPRSSRRTAIALRLRRAAPRPRPRCGACPVWKRPPRRGRAAGRVEARPRPPRRGRPPGRREGLRPAGDAARDHEHRGPLPQDRLGRGRTMKNVWIIAKKELRAYFTSPIAYVVIIVFLVLVGYLLLQPGLVVQRPGHADGPEPLLRPADQHQPDGLLAALPQHGHHPHPDRCRS